MRNRSTRWAIVITAVVTAGLVSLFFVQSARPIVAQAQAQSQLGRIAGHPDFSGIWEANNTANWDLLTHESRPLVGQPGLTANSVVLAAPVVALGALGWIPPGTGIVENNEIPYLPWAAQRKKENQEHWIDR